MIVHIVSQSVDPNPFRGTAGNLMYGEEEKKLRKTLFVFGLILSAQRAENSCFGSLCKKAS